MCCLARAGFSPISRVRHIYRAKLALNTPDRICTVDINRNADAAANAAGANYPDYLLGEAFLHDPAMRGRIEVILVDSREIDFSTLYGTTGMVAVDCGHSYEAQKFDTENALRLVRSGAIIVWDD